MTLTESVDQEKLCLFRGGEADKWAAGVLGGPPAAEPGAGGAGQGNQRGGPLA